MADRYLLESGAPDGYLLEDGSGVLLLEQQPGSRVALPLVAHRTEGERRRRGAKAEVRTLRARLWGNSGDLSASLPGVQARVEQNATSVVQWDRGSHPVVVGRRRKYGAILLRGATFDIAVDGAVASTLGPLAASLDGTVVNPTGRLPAVVVVSPERRVRGALPRVQVQRARLWGNTGTAAAQFGPLAADLAGTVANPVTRLAPVLVVSPERRVVGAHARVTTLRSRQWGNSGSVAVSLPALGMTATNVVATGRTFFVEC